MRARYTTSHIDYVYLVMLPSNLYQPWLCISAQPRKEVYRVQVRRAGPEVHGVS